MTNTESTMFSTSPSAIFCTEDHALMFFDSPKGRWFLNQLYALPREATTGFITKIMAENPDLDHFNRTPNGEVSNGIILLPLSKTTIPSDIPRHVFVGMTE